MKNPHYITISLNGLILPHEHVDKAVGHASTIVEKDLKKELVIYQSILSVEKIDGKTTYTKHKQPSLLEFDPLNCIDFNVKDNVDIKAALDEALEFLQTHHVDQVNIYAYDYLFMIDDEEADIELMYKEFLNSKETDE